MIALASAFELTVAPLWRAHQAAQAKAGVLQAKLASYARVASARSAHEALRVRLEQSWKLEHLAFADTDPGRAAAQLQARLKSLVDSSGGKLLSTQMLPIEPEGAFYRLSARLRVQVSDEAIGNVLYRLESDVPYLFIEALTVTTRRSALAAVVHKYPALANRALPPLDVELLVTTYMRRPISEDHLG